MLIILTQKKKIFLGAFTLKNTVLAPSKSFSSNYIVDSTGKDWAIYIIMIPHLFFNKKCFNVGSSY